MVERIPGRTKVEAQVARFSCPRWTRGELRLLIAKWPDYDEICALLPHRTKAACQTKISSIGMAKARYKWTTLSISRLRKLYPTATWDELFAAFPGATKSAIRIAAGKFGTCRKRASLFTTEYAIIDEIRIEARRQGLRMEDLDAFTSGKTYFRNTSALKRFQFSRVVSALELLGGRLVIDWSNADRP